MMKLLILTILFSFPAEARVGTESIGGGGVLARLLVASQDYLRREIPRVPVSDAFADNRALHDLYVKVAGRMPKDLAQLKLISVNKDLTDQAMGYLTWIRILPGTPITLEYNPAPELFSKLVDTRLLDAPQADETPRLRDVMAFLLHELGHYYGLGEEDAWRFASGLQKELDLRSAARLKKCNLSYADPAVGATEALNKNFTLGGMDAYLFSTPARTFSLAHAFRTGAPPQLVLSVTNVRSAAVELSLFLAADSQLSLLQMLGSSQGFLNVQCEITR
jgi:hypothetical protein